MEKIVMKYYYIITRVHEVTGGFHNLAITGKPNEDIRTYAHFIPTLEGTAIKVNYKIYRKYLT